MGPPGEPTIHLYKDKRTGQPKGDGTISSPPSPAPTVPEPAGTISYEEPSTARAAIDWSGGKPFGHDCDPLIRYAFLADLIRFGGTPFGAS